MDIKARDSRGKAVFVSIHDRCINTLCIPIFLLILTQMPKIKNNIFSPTR